MRRRGSVGVSRELHHGLMNVVIKVAGRWVVKHGAVTVATNGRRERGDEWSWHEPPTGASGCATGPPC
ncbi:Protein of unknown function [Micromonospora lupini str. Lupac 08]|uniref:Uncharacterized protein n=1 Tax=Micromonospora lupini str. Lupac 08 TaxID=1150864 RepID=I0L5G4_9ACTN|nr:Protein of unknown function [Micromonospora lupini str. Lupac 08]